MRVHAAHDSHSQPMIGLRWPQWGRSLGLWRQMQKGLLLNKMHTTEIVFTEPHPKELLIRRSKTKPKSSFKGNVFSRGLNQCRFCICYSGLINHSRSSLTSLTSIDLSEALFGLVTSNAKRPIIKQNAHYWNCFYWTTSKRTFNNTEVKQNLNRLSKEMFFFIIQWPY